MTEEEGLIVGYVFITNQRLTRGKFRHPVNQQERVTVWQVLQYLLNIHVNSWLSLCVCQPVCHVEELPVSRLPASSKQLFK